MPSIRSTMMDSINEKFDAMGDAFIVQGAAKVTKDEYEALGLDTTKLQNSYIINIGALMLLEFR